jgi:hypothetical protein
MEVTVNRRNWGWNGSEGRLNSSGRANGKIGKLKSPRVEAEGTRPQRHPFAKGLVHTVLRVPGALLFAHENNLTDMVGIVGADVREHLRGLF